MEEKNRSFIKWVKSNKKQLTIAGVSVLGIVLIALGIKNKDTLTEVWESLKKIVSKAPVKDPNSGIAKVSTALALDKTADTEFCDAVSVYTSPSIPYEVSEHLRNLPEGWHPSTEKIAEATELGIDLLPNQTFVDAYIKGRLAA